MSRSIRVTAGHSGVSMPDGKIYDGEVDVVLTDAQYEALGPNVFTSGLLVDLGAVVDPDLDAVFATDAQAQPMDSDLTAIAALTTTPFGRAFLTLANAAAGRTALGLGTAALVDTGTGGANVPTITQADARYQPLDSDLQAIALLTTTTFGRNLLAAADAAALRTAAGLGTAAVVDTGVGAANVPTTTLADARFANILHAARHAPGGADTLDGYYAGRSIAAAEAIATPLFTLDGTSGQVINTFYDVGVSTPTFTVNNKPLLVTMEAVIGLKNGTTQFTGNIIVTLALVCVSSSNAADVGVVFLRAVQQHDQAAVSSAAASAFIRSNPLRMSRVFTVGSGGLAAGNVVSGATYSFKMQIQTNKVVNIATLVTSQGFTYLPAAKILVEEC